MTPPDTANQCVYPSEELIGRWVDEWLMDENSKHDYPSHHVARKACDWARAEAKAKEPQCKCAPECELQGEVICDGPYVGDGSGLCANMIGADRCAHFRACHPIQAPAKGEANV